MNKGRSEPDALIDHEESKNNFRKSSDVHPIDAHVGERLRFFRKALGMSQEKLAAAVGLTFQQIQKYEKGMNRVSCSRLFEFCCILKVRVADFFLGIDQSAFLSYFSSYRNSSDNVECDYDGVYDFDSHNVTVAFADSEVEEVYGHSDFDKRLEKLRSCLMLCPEGKRDKVLGALETLVLELLEYVHPSK